MSFPDASVGLDVITSTVNCVAMDASEEDDDGGAGADIQSKKKKEKRKVESGCLEEILVHEGQYSLGLDPAFRLDDASLQKRTNLQYLSYFQSKCLISTSTDS